MITNDDASSSFTRIPNSVLDWLLGPEHDLTFRQVRVLLSVFRFTYGFSRRSAPLSSRYLAEYTGLDQSDCSKALKALVDAGLLTVTLQRKIGFYTLCPRKYKNKQKKGPVCCDEGDSPSRGCFALETEGDSPSKIKRKEKADGDLFSGLADWLCPRLPEDDDKPEPIPASDDELLAWGAAQKPLDADLLPPVGCESDLMPNACEKAFF